MYGTVINKPVRYLSVTFSISRSVSCLMTNETIATDSETSRYRSAAPILFLSNNSIYRD